MALLFRIFGGPTISFAAPPKTGSKFVRSVLATCGKLLKDDGIHIPGFHKADHELTVTRGGDDWIRSYRVNMASTNVGVPEVDLMQRFGELQPDAESFHEMWAMYRTPRTHILTNTSLNFSLATFLSGILIGHVTGLPPVNVTR